MSVFVYSRMHQEFGMDRVIRAFPMESVRVKRDRPNWIRMAKRCPICESADY